MAGGGGGGGGSEVKLPDVCGSGLFAVIRYIW